MNFLVNTDVAIVGGGIAGLVAAARTVELGLRATVIERGSGEDYACNSRFAGGIYHVCYHDPKSESMVLQKAIADVTKDVSSPELVDAVANHAGRAVDWLHAQGVRFVRGPEKWQAWVSAPPRPPSTWLDWKGRGQDVALRTLAGQIAIKGGEIIRGTRALSLIMRNECCAGVRVDSGGQQFDIAARAVVIADGGFQGNAELFRQHIGPEPGSVLQRGAGNGMGDGMRMAQEAGAALVGLDRFYGHILSRDALSNERLWPYPQIDLVAAAAIVVGADGRRFLDESLGGIFIANALAALNDPLSATAVFDSAIWERAGKAAQIPPNPMLEKAGGTLIRSDTLAGLAQAAGLPIDALERTVSEYNAQFPREGKSMPVVKPPYFAIPLCAGITNTMGGIAIDAHARVKRKGGGTIEGLYAAGSATGGLEGGPQVAYVGGLIKAVVLGLLAAEHICRETEA